MKITSNHHRNPLPSHERTKLLFPNDDVEDDDDDVGDDPPSHALVKFLIFTFKSILRL